MSMFHNIGEVLLLLWGCILRIRFVWEKRRIIEQQLYEIGNASLFMACVLSAFIGGVLALQTGPVLADRGLSAYLGQVVALSMCRELAPVMMAVFLAGRVGSAMAAELGAMVINQEIEALKTMDIDPIKFLVMPRVIAITIALPILVIFSNLVGWLAAAFVAHYNYRVAIPIESYFSSLKDGVDALDVINGLIKSVIFGALIGAICCHQGLTTFGGPRGVGRSVTKAVVNSIIAVLILDYFLTRLLLQLD